MSGFGNYNNSNINNNGDLFGAPPTFAGGGFGTSGFSPTPPLANYHHGTINPQQQQQQQQQQPMFGAPPPLPSQSFGTQLQYQQQPQQQSSMMFGSSPNVTAPGLTIGSSSFGGGGFGTILPSSNTSTFGIQPPPTTPFTSSSSTSPFINSTTTTSIAPNNNIQRHQPPQFTPFGNSAPAAQQQPFGFSSSSNTGMQHASPFATTSSNTTPNPIGFGAAQQQQFQQQQQAGPVVAFGMSSNVMTTTNAVPSTSMVSFGASNSIGLQLQQNSNTTMNTPFASSRYTTNSPLPNPFGAATTPFQQRGTNSDDMSDDDGAPAPAATMTTGILSTNPFSGVADQQSVPFATAASDSNRTNALAKLQAKIAQKKKKIEEKKRLEINATTAVPNTTTPSGLRSAATPFLPTSSSLPLSVAEPFRIDTTAVAQRNAIRFAESNDTTTRSQLPSDLLVQESAATIAEQTALRNSGGSGGREYLENAVSLVGTCHYMCPDEELLRREREGDIQLLERPDVQIHPSSWTLRDTMVKRFRRSAADYKLDVPEWIRPPDTLEKVCGYLEEWVMERDRQGPDPRYKNVPSPPPLDVYQFVWDRTRMVRKDFILQNFVGTGGLVDARAVRCHERIARWHCLCEHQLSHINEYVLNQSQQNVQELGQTMKTLNQFYDDSMGRTLREVPDGTGNETRTDFTGLNHGCGAEIIQGQRPIDYDGTPMMNETDNVTSRTIGIHAVRSEHHGTAEPEMRGLYILLTIDNDGGMEVNKYASRLYEERPEVYHTTPVQLALSVYKAKIDRNYAKFFNILRAPSTSYLFACLMFKHVVSMRKNAIRFMNHTYGGRHKDGNIIYDEYPLQHLTSLLCFEDDDETRTACRHYNITVQAGEDGNDTIHWKASSFREAKDPEKGTIIPLRPQKMIKTIERKLNGATRLAVCRGELSGRESYLSQVAVQLVLARNNQSDSKSQALQKRTEYIRHLNDFESKQNDKRDEIRQQELIERQKLEEINRVTKLALRRKQEDEMKRQIQLEVEQRQQTEIKVQREALEKEQNEKKVRLEQEVQRRMEDEALMRQEVARQKLAEEERNENLRQEREIKMREEMERKRQQDVEREQRRDIELKRIQRERDDEIIREKEKERTIELLRAQEFQRLRRESEKLQRQKEEQQRSHSARSIVVWFRHIKKTQSVRNANRINDMISRLASSLATMMTSNQNKLNDLLTSNICTKLDTGNRKEIRTTILLKIAVMYPAIFRCEQERQLCRMIRTWLRSRLSFDEVSVCRGKSHNLRIVLVDNTNSDLTMSTCDAAIFIVPPPLADNVVDRLIDIRDLLSTIDDDVPRLAIALFDHCNSDSIREKCKNLSSILSRLNHKCPIAVNKISDADSLEDTILDCIEKLGSLFDFDDIPTIERCSVIRMIYRCIGTTLWTLDYEKREDIGIHTTAVISSEIRESSHIGSLVEKYGTGWPTREFAIVTETSPIAYVSDYFRPDSHLPVDWASNEQRSLVENEFLNYGRILEGPFSTVIERLIVSAPYHVRFNCQKLLDQQCVKHCLQSALQWRMTIDESDPNCRYVYLPAGMIDDIIRRTIQDVTSVRIDGKELKTDSTRKQSGMHNGDIENFEVDEQIDLPPLETSPSTDISLNKRRRFSGTYTPSNNDNHVALATLVPRTSVSTQPKRRRTTATRNNNDSCTVSKRVSESLSFTKKLQNFLRGSSVDMMIGKSYFLSTALADTPPLIAEIDDIRKSMPKYNL